VAVVLTPTHNPNAYVETLARLRRGTGLPDVVIGAAAAALFRHFSRGGEPIAEIAAEIKRFAAPYLAKDPS
jgi:hypothetical protein